MKLRAWLKDNRKTQNWLAAQLGKSPAAVSRRLTAQARDGRELPRGWIPTVVAITHGEVGLHEEWPVRSERMAHRGTSDGQQDEAIDREAG